ncbi:putative epoxide hydrolase [Xylogone sp. PMI_703]|nr:putative epoxide hydrolase [Xylogone sp. PMI_703]
MFEGFEPFDIDVQLEPKVSIHGVHKKNSGPALLFLHGFPQTHHIWHKVAPQLTDNFSLVAMDLRGYGASTKLLRSEGHKNYAKSAMARDCATVMEKLGYDKFFICAHDRGARVAHKLCVDYPGRVIKAIFLDICPTLAMYGKTDFEFAKAYFHWFFLIQRHPLPETMISQNPRAFAEMFMGGRHAGLKAFTEECFAEYVSVLENSDAVEAMCEDYRASSTIDMDEAREDIAAHRLIQNPLRVMWGKYGVIEKCFKAVDEWAQVSTSHVDGQAVESGHYIPEEAPDVVVRNIKDFFL